MPELPEVETIARKLQKVLPGKIVTAVQILHPKSFLGDTTGLIGQPILEVSRRSKLIRLHLPQQQNILIHLKMTGQLIFDNGQQRVGGGHPTKDWIEALPGKHTRIIAKFDDNSQLFFNDQRLFGWWKVADKDVVDGMYATLAADVVEDIITAQYLYEKIKHRGIPIKQLIMDNSIVAGVGNIYACDALNMARISPFRLGKTLSLDECSKLVQAMKLVITQGIELGGTTFDGKYVDIEGMAGKYQSVVRVYGRAGKPCLNCGNTIVKIQLGGRGTYYCPHCQT